eukprot:140148_1
MAMVLKYIIISILCIVYIFAECGYYAEKGVAVPLDECQHYVGYSVSFLYSCTGEISNNSEIIAIKIYKGNEHCSSTTSEITTTYKYCDKDGITCNCNGIGSDCLHTLTWRYEDYHDIDIEIGTQNKCNDESYSEWTYVVNECIPDYKGGSTKLICYENINSDVDDFKLIQFHTKDCNDGGVDITSDLITNCTTVICNTPQITTTNITNTEHEDENISTKISLLCLNIFVFVFILN